MSVILVRKKGQWVSKSGIPFKRVKARKGASAATTMMYLTKKYGTRNLEVIKRGGKYLYFIRVRKKRKVIRVRKKR